MHDVRMRGFRERTAVARALEILERRIQRLGDEPVPIALAAGRVAAEYVAARASVPHFARAAMDGYALPGEATRGATAGAPVELALVGASFPGRPHGGAIRPGEAVRITTGAPVPDGADAVLMAEHAEEVSGRAGGAVVRVRQPVPPGKHVAAIGEDVMAGAVVVPAGRRLRPQDVGVLASTGVAEVRVVRRPSVRILITGDELLPPGSVPSGASIVDSNSLVLSALARRDGAGDASVEYVPDRREAVRGALAAAGGDVVLVSGGSSVGPEDHAPLVLAELGEVAVHGVAMRPAKPAGFGFLADGRAVFLLPGNPVSCLCAYEFFAGPAIRALGGLPRAWPHRRRRCVVASKIVSERGRVDYVRVRIDGDRVSPIATGGASILSSTTRADGVVIVQGDEEAVVEGDEVEVLLYDA
ncbi:molybdenum cofactor biosynthesis protein MoeA [Sorangium cellulosum]|uniref:Molybdopterin molybdenumtransferase n=1 Tax=Sorangium cellulosum TaxID=56 RepID=A0A4P2QDS9_SORCE|nr:gephyrin-like molybdotransferase Glp [Sorangium cellulosum]AUX27849.1 molybdenum cofactor biosynthesis protein MoeA [Sorangium cellulosum]